MVYDNKGDYDEALEWLIKAYRIMLKILGAEHPNTQVAYGNMEAAYAESEKPGAFEDWLKGQISRGS
jgi:hypothetical protein